MNREMLQWEGEIKLYDLSKLLNGKSLTQVEEQVLIYIIDHIDEVLEQGVRKIAKENYTSTSTIMRLAKKMGYNGFVDMHYKLLPLVKKSAERAITDEDFVQNFSANSLFEYISHDMLMEFARKMLNTDEKFIFIYATGFSGIAAEYMYKKFLVLGKKCMIASAKDSIGVFENNLDSIDIFIAISKSGETQLVLDKIQTAKENQIPTIGISGHGENSLSKLVDLNFQIRDNNSLDDRNMSANTFFPNVLMLTELFVYEYYRQLIKLEKETK